MNDLHGLSEAPMRRIEPCCPLSHGMPRVDDLRMLGGMVFVIRNGLRRRDAPGDHVPHETIRNRSIRWGRLRGFDRILAGRAAEGGPPGRIMTDATRRKAHRTAAARLQKGMLPDVADAPGAA